MNKFDFVFIDIGHHPHMGDLPPSLAHGKKYQVAGAEFFYFHLLSHLALVFTGTGKGSVNGFITVQDQGGAVNTATGIPPVLIGRTGILSGRGNHFLDHVLAANGFLAGTTSSDPDDGR